MSTKKYRCPICGQRYTSPVQLNEAPLCSGGRKHKPSPMKEQ